MATVSIEKEFKLTNSKKTKEFIEKSKTQKKYKMKSGININVK